MSRISFNVINRFVLVTVFIFILLIAFGRSVLASCSQNPFRFSYAPACDCQPESNCLQGNGNYQYKTCVDNGCGAFWWVCSLDDPRSQQCNGVGSCGGTRGACTGDCPSGQVCRAPAVSGNGDACSCHPSGGGQQCSQEKTCVKKISAGGSGCNGGGLSDSTGCSGCTGNQDCCTHQVCIQPIDPIGTHNPSNCTDSRGWTCDESDFTTPLTVGFYLDGPPSASNFLGSTTANLSSGNPADEAAIAAQCGGYGNRRFVFDTPDFLLDGQSHTIYAQAIDVGAGDNVLLSGTPKTINCAPPNEIPTLTSLTLKNSSGSAVSWDTGSKNQICKSNFQADPLPRRVTFEFTLNDGDGGGDILTAQMRWNGTVTNLTLGATTGNSRLATATVDYTGIANANTNPVYIRITDALSDTGWDLSGYSWKVWNCIVPVSGNMYDSSGTAFGAQCPSGAGFSTLADATMNFKSTNITQVPGATTVVNATGNNAYTASNVLTWASIYQMTPNADLAGSGVVTRWIDLGLGTTNCGVQKTLNTTVVDPYDTAPQLQVDFSAVTDQSPWFSVRGGGIQAAGTVSDMVPVTCSLNGTCVPAMSSELGVGESNNGIVAGSAVSNNSGCAMDGSQCSYGEPNNWYKNGSTLTTADKYNYQYFYDKYFGALLLGETLPANSTMTDVKSIGGTGVILVNGDFNVDVGNTMVVGNFLMVVAKGKITFDQGVNAAAGVFVADAGLFASGTSATQLVIDGMLYSSQSGGDVKLDRGYVDDTDNNTAPAVLVRYRPDLLFNMSGPLMNVLSGWKQY